MKMTSKGQVTIPPAMHKKHGWKPPCEVTFIDQPNGILVVKAGKLTRGKQVVSTLLRGGKVNGRSADWLRLTRAE
jgi:bifunctional DNA-binding transcriptional regulator/antitoxin component of YhaV-PrlF toxin-antitoxin module